MKPFATAALVAACVWAGYSFPVLALAVLLALALFGATYELVRTQK